MPDVLVAATVLSLLFAVLMTVIAAKLLRESRSRSSSRIEALQALAAHPQVLETAGNQMDEDQGLAMLALPSEFEPATRALENLNTLAPEDLSTREPEDLIDWDFALRDEPPTLPRGPMPRSQPMPVQPQAPAPARAVGNADFGDVPVFHRPAPTSLWKTGTSPTAASPTVSEHDLFEAAIPPTPSRRWTWVAAVAFVMFLGSGTFYLISSGVIGRAMARHDANLVNANALPIELLSLRYSTEAGNFVVTGLVQNPAASVSLRGVQAVVYLFDAEGKFIASARASLETGVLSPGGESSFVVRVPTGTDVTKYRVSFQHDDGAAVQHVDRRGALPANTTGDAVEPPPASTHVITAKKNG